MSGIARYRVRETFGECWLFAERRSRTTTESHPNPTWGNYSTQVDQYRDYSPLRHYCEDVSGNHGGDNPCQISHENNGFARVIVDFTVNHHSALPYGLERQWNIDYELPCSARVVDTGPNEQDIIFVTRAAADTNPSAPEFDLPVFLGEMRDVPSLLKSVGSKLSKYGAGEYLKYQYGWKPFIKDVRKLVAGMDRLDRIFNNLRRLRKDDVLRRRYEPKGEYEAITGDDFVDVNIPDPWGFGLTIDMHRSIAGSRRRWCVLRYKAERPEGLPETDSELMSLAKRVAYGGTIDGSTFWELMPWSWLIDWNTNMSEYISSQRNIVGAKLTDVTLMRETNTTCSFTPTVTLLPGSNISLNSSSASSFTTSWTCKERFTDVKPAAVITGEVSLLRGDFTKQSILGALALQRLKGLPF